MADRLYVTVAEVLARSGSQLEERDLENVIAAVTDRIERETNRAFVASETETRSFYAQRDGYCVIDDLLSVESVIVEGVALTDYRLRRANPKAAYHALTGEFDRDDEISLTGCWGTTAAVPTEIKDITITWVRRIIKSDDVGGSQDVTAIPEMGQLVYSKAIPADVKRVLDRWRNGSNVNELDDTVAARLGAILRLDETLHVFDDAPEKVDDVPAAIVAEITGDTNRAAYGGLNEADLTARVLVLVALRGKVGLPKANTLTRPYVGRIVKLLWTHDELAQSETAEPIGEIKRVGWKEGNIPYGGVDFLGVEFTIEMRIDWQMVYGSGPVATLPA